MKIHYTTKAGIAMMVIGLAIAAAGCQSTASNERLDSNCNASFANYERQKASRKLLQESKALAGNVTSLAVSGGMLITETLLYIGGGVVVGTLVCSPIIAIEAAAESKGEASVECVTRVGSQAAALIAQESDYSMTRKVWDSTKSFRIKSYDTLVVHLLDSVECRLDAGSLQDIEIADRQLRLLKQDPGLMKSIEPFTKRRITFLSRSIRLQQNSGSNNP